MSKIFLIKWGSYDVNTFFCFGSPSKKKVLKFIRQHNPSKKYIRQVKAAFDPSGSAGFYWQGCCGNIIWIKDKKLSIECLGTISHEVHHAIYFQLVKLRSMRNELEAQAYQFEFLFKKILEALEFDQKLS